MIPVWVGVALAEFRLDRFFDDCENSLRSFFNESRDNVWKACPKFEWELLKTNSSQNYSYFKKFATLMKLTNFKNKCFWYSYLLLWLCEQKLTLELFWALPRSITKRNFARKNKSVMLFKNRNKKTLNSFYRF